MNAIRFDISKKEQSTRARYHAERVAAPHLMDELGLVYPIHYRERGGTRHLELFKASGRRTAMRISKTPDGLLHCEIDGEPVSDRSIFALESGEWMAQHLIADVEEKLVNRTVRAVGSQEYFETVGSPYDYHPGFMRQLAKNTVEAACSLSFYPRSSRSRKPSHHEVSFEGFHDKVCKLINRDFIDEVVADLHRKIWGEWNLLSATYESYNHIARNLEVLQELERDFPGFVQFWYANCMGGDGTLGKFAYEIRARLMRRCRDTPTVSVEQVLRDVCLALDMDDDLYPYFPYAMQSNLLGNHDWHHDTEIRRRQVVRFCEIERERTGGDPSLAMPYSQMRMQWVNGVDREPWDRIRSLEKDYEQRESEFRAAPWVPPDDGRPTIGEFIKGEASQHVEQRLGKWVALRLVLEDKTRRLDILCPEKGRPELTIETGPDGRVAHRRKGKPVYRASISPKADRIVDAVLRTIAAELLRYAYRKGYRDVLVREMNVTLNRAVTGAARDIARRCIAGLETVSHGRTRRTPAAFRNISVKAGSVIENDLLDAGVKDYMQRKMGGYLDHTSLYNTAAYNRTLFEELERTNPVALTCWMRYMKNDALLSNLEELPVGVTFDHPGQFIAAVRNELALSNSEWRALTRMPESLIRSRGSVLRINNLDLERCRALAKVVAAINRPDASEEHVSVIAGLAYTHQHMWNQADARVFPDGQTIWDKWVMCLNRYATTAKPKYFDDYNELQDMGHALETHCTDGEPWGPGDWENLTGRVGRWRDEMAARRQREAEARRHENLERERIRSLATWDSPLEPYRLNGLLVEPVTSHVQMVTVGQMMNNCLPNGTFTDSSVDGSSMVFTITEDEDIVHAVEMRRRGVGPWYIRQSEPPKGRRNRASTGKVLDVTNDLCHRLNVAAGLIQSQE